MRTLAAVALSLLLASTASAKPAAHHAAAGKHAGHASHPAPARRSHRLAEPVRHGVKRVVERLPIVGQSIGAPWGGSLHEASELPEGDGYTIRRPQRAFGTRTTIEYVSRVIAEVRQKFPDQHELAIGDISAEHGGPITQHRSHQAGRDIDIGLFYYEKPPSYPNDFVHATADNLDCEATFALITGFAGTMHEDGGAQMIFLDYDVQGLLYDWAKDHGVSDERLGELLQYPHGRSSGESLVRHWPGHDNHIHVRFKCPDADTSCR
jgi:hypothetical protein